MNELKYGMPTDKENIKNKNIATYSAMMLQTKHDKNDKLDDRRYLYANNFKIEEVIDLLKVSKRTVQRNINALIKSGMIEVVETSENGCVYKFNYKKDNKYFVEIEHDILTELVSATNSNTIATYLLMKYHLKDGKKQMTQEFIAQEIGISTNSLKTIRNITQVLTKLGLIITYEKEGFTTYKTNDGVVKTRPVKELWYELRDYDDWKFLDKNIRQKL